MVAILPTDPVRAAALAVHLKPRHMSPADLRAACTTVLTRGHELGHDALTWTAKARTLADTIDRGLLA